MAELQGQPMSLQSLDPLSFSFHYLLSFTSISIFIVLVLSLICYYFWQQTSEGLSVVMNQKIVESNHPNST